MPRFPRAAAVMILLSIMAAAMTIAALGETQTWDEGGHLTAAYVYLTTGHVAFFTDHPILRSVYALPLLAFHLKLPTNHPTWAEKNATDFATQFLYTNPYHPDQILDAARIVPIVITLLFGLALFLWTRRHLSASAALLALTFFVLDPNLIAHGHYVTTDILAAVTFFLAVVAWSACLESPTPVRTALAGAALALAFAAKFSALALLPVWGLLALAAVIKRTIRWRRLALISLGAPIIAILTLAILYLPETLRGDFPFITGLNEVLTKSTSGHDAYLLGKLSHTGWWYYFPVVFAVKTPLALLAALAISFGGLLWRRPSFRNLSLTFWTVAIPPVTYFAISMANAINIGVRHLLPVYPFVFIAAAALLLRLPNKTCIVTAIVLFLATETAHIHPHYLAFFNRAAGGPGNGPHYLLDSNIDWGQDVKYLRSWMRVRHIPSVCMAYFGNTGVEFYGVPTEHLPTTTELGGQQPPNCYAVISVTLLHDLYVPPGTYAWLRPLTPIDKVGWSLYIYDLRHPK